MVGSHISLKDEGMWLNVCWNHHTALLYLKAFPEIMIFKTDNGVSYAIHYCIFHEEQISLLFHMISNNSKFIIYKRVQGANSFCLHEELKTRMLIKNLTFFTNISEATYFNN